MSLLSVKRGHAWKGGRIIHKGYIYIYKPDHHFSSSVGYVAEHRLVWELYHNACLLPWADVHHINKIKDDNRPENLFAINHGAHRALHHRDKEYRTCMICGSDKTFVNKQGSRVWRRHPVTKEKWLCKSCCGKLQYKLTNALGEFI